MQNDTSPDDDPTVRVTITVPQSTLDALDQLAEDADRSRSATVRRLIKLTLASRGES